MLLTRNLAYEYPSSGSALKGVDFSLTEGGSLALIGANGAGKSTLLSLIVGIFSPTSGEIFFKDMPVNKANLPVIRQKIGLIFQNPEHQLFCGTVLDDVMFGPLNMGLSHSEAEKRANSVLNELCIQHLAGRASYRLSAGEKRLASIACVLSSRPELLLMDEPSAELDPRARRELIALLNRLPQAKVIATHDLDFAVKTCGSAMILYDGKIAANGGSSELLSDSRLLESFGL